MSLTLTLDLRLLNRQKYDLLAIEKKKKITADQESSIRGIANLLDFIQDTIVDHGLAHEREVFRLEDR